MLVLLCEKRPQPETFFSASQKLSDFPILPFTPTSSYRRFRYVKTKYMQLLWFLESAVISLKQPGSVAAAGIVVVGRTYASCHEAKDGVCPWQVARSIIEKHISHSHLQPFKNLQVSLGTNYGNHKEAPPGQWMQTWTFLRQILMCIYTIHS